MRLTGVRVLVPRPKERARELCFLLEDEGAEVIVLPVLEILAPLDPRGLNAALDHLIRYAWIALASPAAVDALADAARERGVGERLRQARIAVVGPRTAKAARARGLQVQLEAEAATGAALAQALLPRLSPGDEVLLPAAQEGRRELYEGLTAAGVAATRVVAYRADRAALEPGAIDALNAHPPDGVLLASPRTAQALLEAIGPAGRGWLERAKLVAIGPTTAAGLQELGLGACAVAEHPTPEGLVEAAVLALRPGSP